MSNSFDEIHYNALRAALANGNAAVMVGAGFSRNAENGHVLATWPDMAKLLWEKLEPLGPPLTDFSSSTVLQLAEQYEQLFSRPALEDLLKRSIPDDLVKPGSLHESLLNLNWCEIFTTNYDTLLERSSKGISDRAHYPVTCREDIPQSKILNRRRIVKLHGSFPSQRPFVFTEEDYRNYPQNAAPFVNLVRQSLLENVLCLIGFSGDDPNFLHWIGWVRDMLDDHALPIYLILATEPSPGQSRLLNKRKVTPVILPPSPIGDKSDYKGRFELFFDYLSKPLVSPFEWISLSSFTPPRPVGYHDIKKGLEHIEALGQSIHHLRSDYPGWLIAPKQIRVRLNISKWGYSGLLEQPKVLEHSLAEDPFKTMVLQNQRCWLDSICLQLFDATIMAKLVDPFLSLDLEAVVVSEDNFYVLFGIRSAKDVLAQWKEAGLYLLSWSRQLMEDDIFLAVKNSLLQRLPYDQHVADHIAHESVLRSIYRGDLSEARSELLSWSPSTAEPYMIFKKGMLLAEATDALTGISVCMEGLNLLREQQQDQGVNVKLLTEEAWACLLIARLQRIILKKNFQTSKSHFQAQEKDVTSQRLKHIAGAGYDVEREFEVIAADLKSEAIAMLNSSHFSHGFDVAHIESFTSNGSPANFEEKLNAAASWLLMTEKVAQIPRTKGMSFNIESFCASSWWLQYRLPIKAITYQLIRISLQGILNAKDLNKLDYQSGWLSRYQVAKVPADFAAQICTSSMSIIERYTVSGSINDQRSILGFRLELLSRFVIRILDAVIVEDLFDRILKLCSVDIAYDSSTAASFSNAFHRIFETLTDDQKIQAVNRILELKVEFKDPKFRYFSGVVPFSNLELNGPPSKPRKKEAAGFIQDATRQVKHDPLQVKPSTIHAWQCLFFLKENGFTSPLQDQKIFESLATQGSWPVLKNYKPWAMLVFCTTPAHFKLFSDWLLVEMPSRLSTPMDDPGDLPRFRWSLGDSSSYLEALEISFDYDFLNISIIRTAFRNIASWWDGEIDLIEKELDRIDELKVIIKRRIASIDRVISKAIAGDFQGALVGVEIEDWLSRFRAKAIQLGQPALVSELTNALPGNAGVMEIIEFKIYSLLLGSRLTDVSLGFSSLRAWITYSKATDSYAPHNLVSLICGLISSRRMPVLPWALRLLTDIAGRQRKWINRQSIFLLDRGLRDLLDILSYDSRHESGDISNDAIPTLRQYCIELAIALRMANLVELCPSAVDWIEGGALDPLPEMRKLAGGPV